MSNPLLSANDLAKLLEDMPTEIIIIDLSSTDAYTQAHIPNAIHISSSQLCLGEKPAPGLLPAKTDIEKLMQSIGLSDKKTVVCYDDAGFSWSGRLIWMLDIIGHRNSAILNGGLSAWQQAGFSTSNTTASITPSDYKINQWHDELIATKASILSKLDDANTKVWDVRSTEEYTGEKALAAKGGHIPNAIHLEWTKLHDAQGNIASFEQLQQITDEYGFKQGQNIITHCQTHRRSGLSYFIGTRLLGFNMQAYPGSWSEWGNSDDTPVETH